MAMFPCPDCGKSISESAEKCSKCGRIISQTDIDTWKKQSAKSKRKAKNIGLILIVIMAAIAIVEVLIPKNKPASLDKVFSSIESTMSDFKDVDIYISAEDDHIICVDVTIDGTANGIAALKLIGSSGDWRSWDQLTSSSANLCKNIKQSVDDMGHNEMHVLYSIKNDENTENIFYSALDGSEIYNIKSD